VPCSIANMGIIWKLFTQGMHCWCFETCERSHRSRIGQWPDLGQWSDLEGHISDRRVHYDLSNLDQIWHSISAISPITSMQFLGFKVTQVRRYRSPNFRGHPESTTTIFFYLSNGCLNLIKSAHHSKADDLLYPLKIQISASGHILTRDLVTYFWSRDL